MKNIETILQEAGIEADKVSGIVSEVNKNYRTVSDYEKQTKKLESAEQRATTAEETLKGFEGKDFDAIIKDRDSWQKKYEEKIKADEEAKEKAELDEAIDAAIKTAKGRNAKAIIAQLDMNAIKASKNRDKDIADAIKELSESTETAFLFETDPENSRAKFTAPQTGSTGSAVTKESIMAIKDRTERINMIAQHRDLFE